MNSYPTAQCFRTESHPVHLWGQYDGDKYTKLCPGLAQLNGLQINSILNAERVRWKFNIDPEWHYGTPIGFSDSPAFLIERESDGLRVMVKASFNPEPVPAAEPQEKPTLENVIMRADVEWTGMAEATRGHFDVFVADRVREWMKEN